MLDETLFRNVLKTIKEIPELSQDLIDSFSDNQFKSKGNLLEVIDDLNILSKNHEVIILGSWYGSLLIPHLANKVKRITCIDLDSNVLKVAKNRLFNNFSNLEFIEGDIFDKDLKRYHTTKLFINTSCEHMPAMNTWPYWKTVSASTYFAFQSNNMYDIDGHTNCVDTIEDFKNQLPSNTEILFEDQLDDSRGIRFTIIGKFI